MKAVFLAAAATIALGSAPPALAQHEGHGQHPPAPPAQPHAGHQTPPPPPAPAPPPHQGHQPPVSPPPAEPVPADHREHPPHAVAAEETPDHAGMDHGTTGALGPYPMAREASGTAWQPDSSVHGGLHATSGDWSFMGHALLNLVYDWQQGPRGDEMAFVSGMVMGSARRDFAGGDTLQLRAMLSPDPFMGRRGYPLHLAAGETADGVNTLIDRQHPHEFFMELSASYALRLGERSSLFLYAGLPGEPAFGPPAFMHRLSIMDSPEAPITHHWLDSTHIVFGVVTAGLVVGDVKIEASRFNGREPDQHRYDIETGPLDSTALRLSWNPTPDLSLQASWGRFISPEQLEPGENQTRWSASAIYTRRLGAESWWSTTLAWGRRSAEHDQLDAFALESAVGLGDWTLFGRAEHIETNELLPAAGHHGQTFDVAKLSLGALHDFRLAPHVRLGIGALYALNFVPAPLEALYAGDPDGAMLFLRLRID